MDVARADLVQDFSRLARHGAPVDPPPARAGSMAEENILRHRKVVEEHRLLVDGRDSFSECGMSGGKRDVTAVETDQTFRRLHDPGHDLDQGRFASAVLADQRCDFAGIERQADAAQRANAGKILADIGQGQARRCVRPARWSRHAPEPSAACEQRLSARRRLGRSPAGPLRFARLTFSPAVEQRRRAPAIA